MATPLLADLLDQPSQQEVIDSDLNPALTAAGTKAPQWTAGSLYGSFRSIVATMKAYVRTLIATVTAAGFEDYCFGLSQPPGGLDVTGWAPLVAKQRYNVDQILATRTLRTIRLTNSADAHYKNIAAGALIVLFPSGNRYRNQNEIPLIPSGALDDLTVVDVVFESEFVNDATTSYNGDPDGATIVIVTASYP